MSRTIVSNQTTNDLSALAELLALAKNPQSIIDAHKVARDQMSITEAEKQKLEEARKMINDYPGIVRDLEGRQAALKNAADQNDRMIKEIATNKSNYDRDTLILATKIKDHAVLEDQLNKLKAELDAQKLAQDRQKTENEAERGRIKDMEEAVNVKITKMKAAIS